jgi:signal peptidase I
MGIRDRDLVPERRKKKPEALILILIPALLTGWGLRLFLHRFFWTPVVVSEQSMAPTLQESDVVTVHRRFESADIARNRLIWLEHPMNDRLRMIRRVVAVAGDRVEVRHGVVLVNGAVIGDDRREAMINETDRKSTGLIQASFFDRGEITLKADEFYVLADGEGSDSRHFGPVPLKKIIGVLPP